MTIQEQLIKLNGLFKKLHNDFASLSTEKNNLDAKYNTLVGALDNKYQSERDRINDQKEEVLKYYRIAKDNSNKELIDHGVALQTPNLAILNNMIEKVNSYSRTDPIAGQIIDLCNGYIAYYNNELGKVDLRRNSEYKVTVLDYLHYNADVIGCLYPISMMKNGLIDSIAQDEKSLKNNILLLASYYRKVESKLGGMSVYDYNKSHSQSDRIPYRLQIISNICYMLFARYL